MVFVVVIIQMKQENVIVEWLIVIMITIKMDLVKMKMMTIVIV
jgi:hypothetical protein